MKTKLFTLFVFSLLFVSLISCGNDGPVDSGDTDTPIDTPSNNINDTPEASTPTDNPNEQPAEEEYIVDYEIGEWKVQNVEYQTRGFMLDIMVPITNKSNFSAEIQCSDLTLILNGNIKINVGLLTTTPKVLFPGETGYLTSIDYFHAWELFPEAFKDVDVFNSNETKPIYDQLQISEKSIESISFDSSSCSYDVNVYEKKIIDETNYTFEMFETYYGWHTTITETGEYSQEYMGCEIDVNVFNITSKNIRVDLVLDEDSIIRCTGSWLYTMTNNVANFHLLPKYKTKYDKITNYKLYVYEYKRIKSL